MRHSESHKALSDWIGLHPVQARAVQGGQRGMYGIKNIIAVASGKGGVGKSTTAVNLALALKQAGAQVGLLDADIHGPNQPLMLGVHERPEIRSQEKFNPLFRYEMPTMSMGYLVDREVPMVWRGPMVSRAFEQLLHDTNWGSLDYLLIDLPPGTGDIALTLAQKVPLAGVLIVTTPQAVACEDASKALRMFQDPKIGISILGMIENMAYYLCAHCGEEASIFGHGAAEYMAKTYGVPLLGRIPMHMAICADVDAGTPTVMAHPSGAMASYYFHLALALLQQLESYPVNQASKFPKVVVE